MSNYKARQAKSWRTRRHQAGGGSVLADAAPLREIVLELRTRMSWPAIARLCGTTSHRHMREIADGTIRRVNHDLAANIYAAAGKTLDEGRSHVSATGAMRRMQSLVAIGYSVARLAEESGYSEGNMKQLVNGRKDVIHASTDALLRATFDRLCMKIPQAGGKYDQGSITRSCNRARAEGWPTPLFWEDPDTDVFVVTNGKPWRRAPKSVRREDAA